MKELIQTNLQSKLFKINPRKTQWTGDVRGLIDCEIAEGFTLANLGQHPPNISFPLVLGGGGYMPEKIFNQPWTN